MLIIYTDTQSPETYKNYNASDNNNYDNENYNDNDNYNNYDNKYYLWQ